MKALAGALSLLVVLGIVSLLVRKQLPAAAASGQQQPSQAVPQQVKQQVEAVLQQPRAIPDDK
jgi:predicted lipid-binding transport protein (Tim44 family)